MRTQEILVPYSIALIKSLFQTLHILVYDCSARINFTVQERKVEEHGKEFIPLFLVKN